MSKLHSTTKSVAALGGLLGGLACLAQLTIVEVGYSHPGHGSHGGSVVTQSIIPRSQEPSAQTVKKADIPPYGDVYGKFRLGHFNGTYFHETQDNHIKSTDVKITSGLTLGTKLFDSALDLSANLGFERTDDSSDIKTLRPALLANWRMLQDTWGVLSSSLLYESAMNDEITESTISLAYGTPALRYNSLSFFSGLSLAWIKPMEDKIFQAEIVDELSSGSDIRTMPLNKTDASTAVTFAVGGNYQPRAIRGLTVKSQLNFLTDYEPYFKVRTDLNGDIASTSKKMVATKSSEAKMGVAYQLTKRAVVSSDLIFRANGFFERPRTGDDSDDNRFENLTSVVVTLF